MEKNLKACVKASKFTSAQFTLRYQPDYSLSAMFRDLLAQAYKHQIETQSVSVACVVLHYLIYAQLELMLAGKGIEIKQCKSSIINAPTTRAGEILIKQVVIHVTTLPTLGLIEKCKENLESG